MTDRPEPTEADVAINALLDHQVCSAAQNYCYNHNKMVAAASLIESLQAENDRLREEKADRDDLWQRNRKLVASLYVARAVADTLREREARLVEALKPFAEACADCDDPDDYKDDYTVWETAFTLNLEVRDFRCARQALANQDQADD